MVKTSFLAFVVATAATVHGYVIPCGCPAHQGYRSSTDNLLLMAKSKAQKPKKRVTKGGSKAAKPAWLTQTPGTATASKATAAKGRSSKSAQREIWHAVRSGTADAKQVKSLLRAGADVHHVDEEGYTLLHVFCANGGVLHLVG